MSIEYLEKQIRELINRPRTQTGLLSDRGTWNMLCSALDVIGDTELALEAYRQWQPLPTDGERYLLVYGVLQVLLVQQDAVRFVCKSLSIDYSQSNELSDIRSIRSDSIGHPIKGQVDNISKSNFIQRLGLTQRCFTLMTVFSDARHYQQRKIIISELLEMQQLLLEAQLQKAVEELQSREMAHRTMHRGNKLEELFPNWIEYLISRCRGGSLKLAPCMMELKNIINRFREALEAREEWNDDSAERYDINILQHALQRLSERFCNTRSNASRNAWMILDAYN